MDTPRAHWVSKYTTERHSHSISSVQEDVLNISPRLSYYNPTISLERKLHRRNSLNLPKEIMPKRNSTSSVPSTEANTPRSVADLVTEIATLELEVAHLERHLLTLYRTAFDQYFPSTSSTISRASSLQTSSYQPQVQTIDGSHQLNEKLAKPFKIDGADGSFASTPKYTRDLTDHEKLTISNSNSNLQNSISGHRSLAEHFGSSIADHVTDISPHRLSEEIIRCISAVYCKLSNAATKSEDSEISISSSTPSGSSSSSSYYSPTETGDGSSSPSEFESPKQKNLPYANTIIVPHIRIDANRFGYASKMLQNFRTLIRRLEKIDPRQMKYEEQLSFWINIHNALVMHAFLAYGLQKNQMKSTHMILKAAYNVGGHSVNACTIQGSILGCEPHRPALWMLALFSSKRRSTTVNQGHVYALDRPEPLAHFAICTGAISDPPLRIYTAKHIYKELEIAKSEFIRANVSVKKQSKILLPRMLYYFGKDSSFELCDILEIICKCLPESQQRKDIERLCLKKKAEKYVEWLPYKSSFRYVVHRSLAQL